MQLSGISTWALIGLAVWVTMPNAWGGKPVFSAGAQIYLNNWSGENAQGDDFEAGAGQLGLQLQGSLDRFFGGIALIGGPFGFNDAEKPSTVAGTSTRFNRSEFDIIGGYHVHKYVALYLNLKNITYTWEDDGNHKVAYDGLGVGGQWRYPFLPQWTAYGHLSLGNGSVTGDGGTSGDGGGLSLGVGAAYQVFPELSLHAGIKQQVLTYRFNDQDEQQHNVGGLVVGAQYAF